MGSCCRPGWNSAYALQPPKRKVKNNETVTKDFSFSAAGNTVTGVVRDSSGSLVSVCGLGHTPER